MSLIDDLVKLEEEAKELVAGADDAAKLEAARVELLGRKGRITGLMRMMGKLAPEDRPMMGKRANEMRQLIEGMLDERTTEMKAAALKHALEHEAVDITLPGIRPQIGHQHLIKQIIEEAEDIFCGIGYTVESGPMVDTSYYNFTALNAPMDHPSRSARDTFYVVDNNPGSVAHPEAHAHGESDVLLRTQTSGVQIHTMESQKPPIYMICPGTVYRPDTAPCRSSTRLRAWSSTRASPLAILRARSTTLLSACLARTARRVTARTSSPSPSRAARWT